jgi:hypothetical protein
VSGGAAPLNEWTVRTRFGSAAEALFERTKGIPETAATTRKNGARGAFRMSHNCNLPGIGHIDATPVGALARGVLDTQRPAAQA